MIRSVITGSAAAVLVLGWGGLGLAGLGLAGSAQADVCSNQHPGRAPRCGPFEGPPQCNADGVCSNIWCPDSGAMRNMPNWDMSICHTYYFAPDTGQMVPGEPPGPPPPPPLPGCWSLFLPAPCPPQ
jgi:hypothetical protein